MQEVVLLENVYKNYRVPIKEDGVKGSLKSLFVKKYDIKTAVHPLNISIKKGEFIGFIGPNGAGKTTVVKMLSGIIHPNGGNINVLGYVPLEHKNEFKKKFSVIMGQKSQLWWDISASESFKMFKEIYGISNERFKSNLSELSEILQIENLLNVPVRNLSLGERMKMEIVASLLHDPEIIFLDEPTIGLDVFSRRNIRDFLKTINSTRKTTIILTSHYIEDIKALCNRIIAIQKGRIVFDGPYDELEHKFVENKRVTITFEIDFPLESLKPLGEMIESGTNRAIFLVEKNHMKDFCNAFFINSGYLDISIEDMPVDEIFEKLFNSNIPDTLGVLK